MKVVVFGGTGFIGRALRPALEQKGHEVLIRDIRRDRTWESDLKTADAVINLAGAPLMRRRWNVNFKAQIFDSRIEGTKIIVAAMERALAQGSGPKVLINGSAIGYYGSDDNTSAFTEDSGPGGNDFLAFVCREWEMAARAAEGAGIRTVLLRTGVVLGANEGALKQMLPIFKLGLGGKIGSGNQWMSWIHIADEVGLMVWALENSAVHGPLNAVAPNPVTNKDFTRALAQTIGRPAFLPVPVLGLYALFGEAAEVIASGQRVLPSRALSLGYGFKFPELVGALQDLLKTKNKNTRPEASAQAAARV